MLGSEKNLQKKRAYLLRILYNRIETKNYRRILNMLTLHDTQSLLNLQGVIVKKVTLDNNFIIINKISNISQCEVTDIFPLY